MKAQQIQSALMLCAGNSIQWRLELTHNPLLFQIIYSIHLVCVFVCVGVYPADQADGWSSERRLRQCECVVLLADIGCHVLHFLPREGHQALPHHAHQEVSGVLDYAVFN